MEPSQKRITSITAVHKSPRDYAAELGEVLAIGPAILEWAGDCQPFHVKEHYYWSELRSLLPIIEDFSLNYGNETPTNNDLNYVRFINLIENELLTASRYGYDHKSLDYNLVYTLAILGNLHPVHIPDTISACDIIKKVLAKHIPVLKADQRAVMTLDIDKTKDDTLDYYYYLLYEMTSENRDDYEFAYTWERHPQYRSGVVYHLLKGGCEMTDRCLNILISFGCKERSVQLIKDFIFVTGDIEKFACRITNHICCTRKSIVFDNRRVDRINSEKNISDLLEEREKLLFWELAELDLFCRHHACLNRNYLLPIDDKGCVIMAMRKTPKSLKNLCRMSIRKSFNPSRVVWSCHQLTMIPPKLRDYIAFSSLDAAIKPFYNVADIGGGNNKQGISRTWRAVSMQTDRIRSLVLQYYNINIETSS